MAWWKWKTSDAQETSEPVADMPLVRLEGITRVFAGDADEPQIALHDVTVDINRGEYVSIAGPSGCGKSTFLSVLALLDTPNRGRYWLNGRATDRLTPAQRAHTRNVEIGLIFQSFNLLGDLTVYENVEYPLTLRGLPLSERKGRVAAALQRVGLTTRAQHRPGSLSGGHQQLVAVARAVAGQPPLVLADEPTGNLDSASGEAVMQMLDDLHASGSTVCIATHDPRYIARAKRHIHLLDGRVVPGTPIQS
jgi:putative ABC transport system ATP-binding protein